MIKKNLNMLHNAGNLEKNKQIKTGDYYQIKI